MAYIGFIGDYNFGFLIYNSSNTKNFELSTEETKNYYDNMIQSSNTEINSYILSFAKKGSQHGVSFILLSSSLEAIQGNSLYRYDSDFEKRKNESFNLAYRLNNLLVGIAYGFQTDITKNIKFGLRLVSPAYLISGKNEFQISSSSTTNVSANDVVTTNFGHSYKEDSIKEKVSEANVNFGFSQSSLQHSYEVNFLLMPATTSKSVNYTNGATFYSWNSATDSQSQTQSTPSNISNEFHKANYNLTVGYEYNHSGDLSMGAGFPYFPTASKKNQGMNTYAISFGASNKHKNFTGNYIFRYTKSVDAGGNFTEIDEGKRKIKLAHESISLILGGSYWF